MIAVTHDYKNTISQIIRPTTQFEADLNIRNVMATQEAEIEDGEVTETRYIDSWSDEGITVTVQSNGKLRVVGRGTVTIPLTLNFSTSAIGTINNYYPQAFVVSSGVSSIQVSFLNVNKTVISDSTRGSWIATCGTNKTLGAGSTVITLLREVQYVNIISNSDNNTDITFKIRITMSNAVSTDLWTPSYAKIAQRYQEPIPAPDYSKSVFGVEHAGDYITFETDYWTVGDGTQLIMPTDSDDYLETGYVSTGKSNVSGALSPSVVFYTNFENPYEFIGLTIQFTSAYPRRCEVQAYLNGTRVFIKSSPVDGLLFILNQPIPLCDRLVFTCSGDLKDGETGRLRSYNRIRIASIMLGVTRTFTNSDIISTSQDSFIDPVTSQLPYNNFRMTIQNFDKDYNPDNPEGIWKYFENGQDLTIKYGVETGTGVEWIPNAKLLLSDAPTVEINKATFTASDTLSYLTETYYKGVYSAEGATLYDLAIAVLQDAGVTKYHIPEALQNTTTNAYLPIVSHKECLQLIANAGRCILFCDSEGAICMREELEPSYTLEDNSHADWSSLTSAFFGANDVDYITFESDRWDVGNDKQYIMPTESSEYIANGYVSSVLSGEGGVFDTPVVITINSSIPVNSDSYSITFDNINEIYATDFTVQFYYTEFDNNTLIKEITVTENDSTTWTYDDSIIEYTKVIITITAINVEGNRLKIYNISGGRETDYYLDYTVSLERPVLKRGALLRQVDVVKHTFTVDEDVTELINESTTALGDLTFDYLPSTNIDVTVTGSGIVPQYDYYYPAHYETESKVHLIASPEGDVEFVSDTYTTDTLLWNTLTNKSAFPYEWASSNKCYLAGRVENPSKLTCRFGTEEITGGEEYVVYTTSSSGSFTALWEGDKWTDGFFIHIDFNNQYGESVKISNLRLLDENNNVYWKASADTFVYNKVVMNEVVGTYAQRATVHMYGEGTVKITGNVLLESESVYTLTKNLTGEVCPLDNPLVTTSDLASKMADWLANYCSLRDTYNMKFRQDYRLEPNDVIYIKTDFEELVPARVYQVGFALQGQTGNISVKRIG